MMAEDIKFADLPNNSFIGKELDDLIGKLTHKLPEKRLGKRDSADIKKHPFFKKINWQDCMDKKLKPPIIPLKKVRKLLKDKDIIEDPSRNPYAFLN